MKLALVSLSLLLMVGCESKEKRKEAFLAGCQVGQGVVFQVLRQNMISVTPTIPVKGEDLQNQAMELCEAASLEQK